MLRILEIRLKLTTKCARNTAKDIITSTSSIDNDRTVTRVMDTQSFKLTFASSDP